MAGVAGDVLVLGLCGCGSNACGGWRGLGDDIGARARAAGSSYSNCSLTTLLYTLHYTSFIRWALTDPERFSCSETTILLYLACLHTLARHHNTVFVFGAAMGLGRDAWQRLFCSALFCSILLFARCWAMTGFGRFEEGGGTGGGGGVGMSLFPGRWADWEGKRERERGE